MTDRNQIIAHIEDLLGSESSPEFAEMMLEELEDNGGVQFDAERGYYLIDEVEMKLSLTLWGKALLACLKREREAV